MIEHLFGSRTRVKLMTLFLQRENEPIFVREVTRLIDTQINAVRRELANLINFGMIIEVEEIEDQGAKRPGLKRKYYRLNAKFPLLPEVRSLMTKAQLLVEHRIDHVLSTVDTVLYVALMGKFLGEEDSPIDLFIVGSIGNSMLKTVVSAMESSIGKEIGYTVMPLSEYEYRKEIADRFLLNILNAPKSVVIDRMNGKE
jgi:hypothetical protein